MSKKMKTLIIILLLIVIVYFIFLIFPYLGNIFGFIYSLLIPFFISFIVAYLINPIVNIFEKFIKKRSLAVMVVLIIFAFGIYLFLKYSLSIAFEELTKIIADSPRLIKALEEKVNNFLFKFNLNNNQISFDKIIDYVNDTIIKIDALPKKIISVILKYLEILAFVPILTIYFSIDFNKIKDNIKNKLEEKGHIRLKKCLGEIDDAMISFIKGYGIIIILLFLASSIILNFIGLKYSILFGLIIGLTDIIPFIGPYLGGAIPVIYTLSTEPSKTITVIIAIVVIQLVESNFLTPYVQSHKVKIHPIVVLLGLVLFGELFGVIGYIGAVPMLSILKIIYLHYGKDINKLFRKDEGRNEV